MNEDHLDPEKGREVAAQLRNLGVRGILITAAELGHISELRCAMPTCLCPEELGGKGHFVKVPEALPEWMPTVDHIQPKSEKGKLTIYNVRLAHRLCNRVHYAEKEHRSIQKDLDKVEAARQRALEDSANRIVRQTDRLELRPTGPEMFDGIWSALNASLNELEVWMPWAIDLKEKATLEFLDRCANEWSAGNDRHFTLFLEGEPCGQCDLIRVDPLQMSAEIGFWLRSDLCGRGLMTEAADELVSFGFWQESLHRIELHAGVENHGSNRVAEKLGFTKQGTLRHSGRGANGFYDSHVYDLLVTDSRTNPATKE